MDPKIHLIAANDRFDLTFSLSGRDAPEGRGLLESWETVSMGASMVMDHAHEGDETRQLVLDLLILA